jgi:hypothetical protein
LSKIKVISFNSDYFEVQQVTEQEHRKKQLLNRWYGTEKSFSDDLLPLTKSALFCFCMSVLALLVLA